MSEQDKAWMKQAIALAKEGMETNSGGPFGAVVVREGKVVGMGFNEVTTANDPTAHAEIVAIRKACAALDSFELAGCTIYASCEPCPMCLGAIYWARISRLVYACTREDAAGLGFDDAYIYREIPLPPGERTLPTLCRLREEGLAVMKSWREKPDKLEY